MIFLKYNVTRRTLFAANHTPALSQYLFVLCNYTRSPVMAEIIKEGYLSVKEDGLRAWIWSKRFCILRDQTLTFHRNEVIHLSPPGPHLATSKT